MTPSTTPRLRIGELATRAGITTKTVRYYEAMQLMPPAPRSASGYRLYSESDLVRLLFVRRAQAQGLTLDAIRVILARHDAGTRPCGELLALVEERMAEIDDQIAELQRRRRELSALAGRATEVVARQSCRQEEICSAV